MCFRALNQRRRSSLWAAFTLAEVLITLSVIGIIAALTITTLVSKSNEKETIVKLKKAYNTIQNAYTLAIADNPNPETWPWIGQDSPIGSINLYNIISPYLKIQKYCGKEPGCLPDVKYKLINNAPYANYNTYPSFAKAIMEDGTMIMLDPISAHCEYGACGVFDIDTNGLKGPNKFGADFFSFLFMRDGRVLPAGAHVDEDIEKACYRGTGQNCTAWAVLRENLDYLK